MNSLEIYRETLLAHNEQPHNFRALSHPTHQSDGHNPLCGDEITVYLRIEGERIKEISFTGQGCAICKASASLMTLRLEGLSVTDAEKDAQGILAWLNDATATQPDNLGELEALLGVRKFPMRIKCATLAWHAFLKALTRPATSDIDNGNSASCGCCCGNGSTSDDANGSCGCGS
jgi:nitrogen fixation NifU-like protein